jgi:hypothetical protein
MKLYVQLSHLEILRLDVVFFYSEVWYLKILHIVKYQNVLYEYLCFSKVKASRPQTRAR